MKAELYFSDYFGIEPQLLHDYGAFDVSVVSDLPLFIDPFLLFNSDKPEYQALHEAIIRYLIFLRDKASADFLAGQGISRLEPWTDHRLVPIQRSEAELVWLHFVRQ